MAFLRWLLAFVLLTTTSAAVFAQGDSRTRAAQAARAMGEHRYDDAARIYQELLKVTPDEPELHANLGMALAMGGHEAEAVPQLERAVALNPKLTNARVVLASSYLAIGQPVKAIAALQPVVAAQPSNLESHRLLAEAYAAAERPVDALTELRKITQIAPKEPAGWYALGHGYNAVAQDAMATFNDSPDDRPWRQLLLADALAADGRLTDAFALYRSTLDEMPTMVSIHDSIAHIYEQTSHADWAARERSKGVVPASACATRKALCEFRAGQYGNALVTSLSAKDAESRYWQARAASELASASFKQLDTLPDSRERREIRATMARGQRRYDDAIAELQAALKMAPRDPELLAELGTAYYFARDFDRTVATLQPLLKIRGDDPQLLGMCGEALLELQRVDDAIAMLERATTIDSTNSAARLALARAYVQKQYFAAAIPLLELEIPDDNDGSIHVQLARAYRAAGNAEKATELLAQSEKLQRASQERSAAAGQRTITPPK